VITVIRSGARGYVTKTISGTELVDEVRRVAGDAVFSPRLVGFVLDAVETHVPSALHNSTMDPPPPSQMGHRTPPGLTVR
jgi:DNA-binding NarL/FixJ family response regulator